MKIKKFLLIFMIILVLPMALTIDRVQAVWVDSSTGWSGSSATRGGSWNSHVVGVRVTAVDKDGKRLSLTVNGKQYISKSIDYYGSKSQVGNGYYASVRNGSTHSVCTLANGTKTLCSKPDVANGANFEAGGYNYENWPYQNQLPLPIGEALGSQSVVNKLNNMIANLGTARYESQANDLFYRLMGQPLTFFQQNATGNCEEIKETISSAYIIFEPLGQIVPYVGTASELALLYGARGSNYSYRVIPMLYNAISIPTNPGNLGLTYFTPVSNEVALGEYNKIQSAVTNTHIGYGVGILAYGSEFVDPNQGWACDFDYTIDAACVNCNSNDSENKAYIIQDTNDWDAIFASKESDNKNVVSYYDKGNGVYCREEYTVYFPNVNNTIYVEPGRYFTVNPSASALDEVASHSAIPNMKPIKVTKKRECRVNTEENGSNASSVLNTFRINSEYDFKGKTGTVSFKYNEVYDDSRYNMDDTEELVEYKDYEESNNYTYSINGNSLTMEVTRNYTLPENYYQYIRKQDGLSMKVKPSSNLNYYLNVGIPNLPISFNNKGSSTNGEVSKAADIQFFFELPGKNNDTDRYSKLYLAYIENNSYLSTGDDILNIYNKYKNNKMEDGDQDLLNKSACAKMFGMNTSGFTSCVNQRVNNSIGEGSNNCIAKSKITSSTTSGYSCMVLTYGDGGDDDCKTEEDANRLGRDWNPLNQSCCPVGTTYNPTLGKCEPDSDNNTCRIENGKYYDFDGNEITKEEYDRICPNPGDGDTCRIENGKYYDFDGNEITKEEYDKICPSNIPPECPTSECPYGCCPSGECAPMPDGTCPGTGGIDVIYRTIDLENPFPGQNAEQRNTGANWCSYNIKTQQIDCKYNNQTAKNYITRERGGTTNGGKVYREDHVLYEVTLDTETINSIRNYNDDHKYDDWTLNCYNRENNDGNSNTSQDQYIRNGTACKSYFLREYLWGKVSGECAGSTVSNFYTCDKDV